MHRERHVSLQHIHNTMSHQGFTGGAWCLIGRISCLSGVYQVSRGVYHNMSTSSGVPNASLCGYQVYSEVHQASRGVFNTASCIYHTLFGVSMAKSVGIPYIIKCTWILVMCMLVHLYHEGYFTLWHVYICLCHTASSIIIRHCAFISFRNGHQWH